MSRFLHKQLDVEWVNFQDITMVNRNGLRAELTDLPWGQGDTVLLPGDGDVLFSLGTAPTAADPLQTEALPQRVRLR